MMKLGISTIAYQLGACRCRPNSEMALPLAWAEAILLVGMVWGVRNTATMDRPSATSYEIICALDRRPPSSGYVEPEAQPARTTPYTAIEEHASSTSTDTGTSVSCSAVRWPNMVTTPPNGITEKAVNATVAEITG